MNDKTAPRKGKAIRHFLTKTGLTKLEGWARNGLTEEQIAHNCGITRSMLWNWRKKYPEVQAALDKGREVVDLEVERALLKSALGYDYEEHYVDSNGKKSAARKHMPANVAAQIFWLKNRKFDQWKDKRDVEVTDAVPVVIKDNIDDSD